MKSGDRDGQKTELRRRFQKLEAELGEVQVQLSKLGPGEVLPGLFLLIDIAGHGAVVPASQAREIVRLMECTPLPKSPPHVLGTFIYRGQSVIAFDLAVFLGYEGERRLDAHVVIMHSVPPAAIVVDRVRAIIEAPVLVELDEKKTSILSNLVIALCRHGDEVLPVLRIKPLLDGVSSG